MAFFSKLMRSAKPRDPRYGTTPGEESYLSDFEDQSAENGNGSNEDAEMHLIDDEVDLLLEAEDVLVEKDSPAEFQQVDEPVNQKSSPDKPITPAPSEPQEKKFERRASDQIKPLINKILSAESTNDILFSLTEDLKNIFKSEGASIYSLDRDKKQLFARNYQNP